MFRTVYVSLALLLCGCTAGAAPWPPSSDHPQMPLWAGAPPDPFKPTLYSKETVTVDPKEQIGGKAVIGIDSVSVPTLTLYRPKTENSGAAVLVFPGGGYWNLAIDLEGTEVCDWLTANGITCLIVKYRTPGFDNVDASRTGPYPKSIIALEASQRAIALTRYHAKEWGIDPHKIGVIGFSAGGHLVAATSTNDRVYKLTDAIDQTSVRPDFGIALYPGHISDDDNSLALKSGLPVDARTPPQFILQSGGDPVDSVDNSLAWYIALKKANVKAELHIFPEGGHAFGLRHTDKAITDWPKMALSWLGAIGMIGHPTEGKRN